MLLVNAEHNIVMVWVGIAGIKWYSHGVDQEQRGLFWAKSGPRDTAEGLASHVARPQQHTTSLKYTTRATQPFAIGPQLFWLDAGDICHEHFGPHSSTQPLVLHLLPGN